MNFKKFLAVFFCGLLTSFSLHAKPYFAGDEISPTLLNPPLLIESKEWKNEVDQIVKLQKKFNPEEIDQALEEKHLRPETVAEAVDPTISRQSFPKLYYLLDRVSETSRDVTDNAKNYWNMPRPYVADKRVSMLITPSKSKSYPSGHTTGSYIYAHVLSLLFPQKRQEFQNRAEKIAQHRVLVGMHYPSDLKGGKQLALLTVGALVTNEEFQEDFLEAQKELAKK